MSAPSSAHERRRAQLDDLALLAGYPAPLWLGADLLPDVARHDRRGRRFVGDAKNTETPRCSDTFRRLSRYARGLAYGGCDRNVLALAVPAQDPSGGWGTLLERVATGAGLRPEPFRVSQLDAHTTLVHVVLSGRGRR